MTTKPQQPSRRRSVRPVLAAVLAVATASCWWAWMAWDRGYQLDPATGTPTGPYEAWQVIGCVLCLIALCVAAAVRLPAWLVVLAMTIAFTAAWSWTAARADDSGLWGVGALLVFAGMLVGTVLISALTAAARTATLRGARR